MVSRLHRWSATVWDDESVPPKAPLSVILLVLLAVAVLARSPHLSSTPRVWAEEGTVYLSGAWKAGPWSLLDPHLGYYSVLPNIAAYTASLLPLTWVPLPFMFTGLLATLACGATILTSRSHLFDEPWVRIASVSALVLVPAAIGELWLNSINAQAVLTVAAFVVILEPAPRGLQVALFAVAALTAPSVTFLLPLLLVRFIVDPRRHRSRLLLVVAGLSTFVQVTAVTLSVSERPVRDTEGSVSPSWLSLLGKVFAGPGSSAHDLTVGAVALAALVVLCILCRGQGLVIIGIGSALWLFTLNTAFSLGHDGGYRYWYAPSVVLLMTVSHVASLRRVGMTSQVAASLLCIALLVGGARTYVSGMQQAVDVAWTSWAGQVGAACSASRTPIRIWPQGRAKWVVRVPSAVCSRQ